VASAFLVPLSFVLAKAAASLTQRPSRLQMVKTGLSEETPSARLHLAGRCLQVPFLGQCDQLPTTVTAVLNRTAVVEDAQGWRWAIRFDRVLVDPTALTWLDIEPDPKKRARRLAAQKGRAAGHRTRQRRVSEASIAAGWDSPD
jgi:hypothetical protein